MGQSQAKIETDVMQLEGLEQFFEPVTDTTTTTPTDTHADVVTVTSTPTGWTLKQAADKLLVSVNTIRKRIKDRELHGYKVQGPNGPEWRITPPTDTLSATTTESATVTNTPTIDALLKVIEGQSKQIDAMSEQLKAASDVMMYQRSQLETRDEQIKLLTDSQHKAGWWQRFKSWAQGR